MNPAEILQAKILVVDDFVENVVFLERTLSAAGYRSVTSTLDPRAVCELHRANHYDLILLDLQMPAMDGFEVMEGLKAIEQGGYLPVLVVTAEPDHKLRALDAGAKDFVTKPFDVAEVLMRVRNMLEVRLYAKALAQTVHELDASRELIKGKNEELEKLLDMIVAERKRSEERALHVPPSSIAARLPARPDATADSFPIATVLVADLIGFAELAATQSAARMAEILDEIFSLFDGLCDERGVRKIKMVGNSYLAAVGIPVATPDHAARAAHLSIDMLESLDRWNERTESTLQLRIGVHTGAVVAGVIGRRQFLYDLWGDAVDTACRVESHGVAGRVAISESTHRLLGDPFLLEAQGALQVQGSRDVRIWFLQGRTRASE